MLPRILLPALAVMHVAAGPLLAQSVPDAVGYQGRLADQMGQPVADGPYQVQFKLYSVENGGVAFWTSPVTTVTTTGGLFSTRLQPLAATDLVTYTDVWLEAWAGDPLSALSPRTKLSSAPFALRAGDLSLPFSRSIATAGNAFQITNTGSGMSGYFLITNTASTSSAVYGRTDGTGSAVKGLNTGAGVAGWFEIDNPTSNIPALYAKTNGSDAAMWASSAAAGDAIGGYTTGTFRAGSFTISNSGNTKDAVYATTNGTGDVIHAYTSGDTGSNAGYFQINNPANASAALYAQTNGSGDAVYGYTGGPTGSNAGYFQINNPANASSALIVTTNGTGRAGTFQHGSGDTDALYVSTAGSGAAVYANTAGTGPAVAGHTSGPTGSSAGYFDIANSSNSSPALYASTNGTGAAVRGYSNGATGSNAAHFQLSRSASTSPAVYVNSNSQGGAISAYSSGSGNDCNAGRFEVDNIYTYGDCLYATTNGHNAAVFARTQGNGQGLYGGSSGAGEALYAVNTGTGWAGYFVVTGLGKGVYITVPQGSTGLNVASGTKNAVVATSSGARLLYTEESTEVWFTDYGFGKLHNGRAAVALDPTFAETVDLTQPYHVFVQLNDLDSAGVGVINKTSAGFEVGELQGGKSNAEFSYRVVAKRRNYATTRLERAPHADEDPNLYPGKAPGLAQRRMSDR